MPDMLNDERSRAVAWLSSITDKEFAEAVHEAARVRCQTSTAVAHANRFVLACVSLDCDTDHWDLEVVALHDPLQYTRGFDAEAPLCQFGRCSSCGFAMVSWAKHAKCSVCGGETYCT